MRIGRILSILVGGIVALFVAVLLAVWLLVNPNAYKGRITAAVKESTGRDLLLTGDIKLALFPRIALELGPASLGNPAGFGEEPFLKFDRASVQVKLLPLLSKQLQMAGVQVAGLDLRMRKNAEGKGNWEGFGGAKASTPRPGNSMKISESLPYLAGIKVTNGRVSYQDIVIDKLSFETGAYTDRGIIPITLGFDAALGTPGENATVNAKFDLSSDATTQEVRFAAVSLSGLASRAGGNQPLHWEFSAPTIDLNLKKQTVAAPAFALRYGGAQVNGNLAGTKIVDDLSITGSVTLAPLVLREFIPRLGIALPRTRDPRALSQLSGSSDFAYDAKGVSLDKILVQLDDTKVHGNVALINGDSRALKFELAVDHLDADRYLSPEDARAESAPKTAAMTSRAAAKPAAASKPFEAQGTLSVASLRFSKMDFTAVHLTVASKNKVLHLFPTQATIDGGHYAGDISLDSRGAIPTLSLDEHLTGIDVNQLLSHSAARNRVSGRGNVNLKATAEGAGADAILKSLDGHFDATLVDGAIEGVDLGYEMGVAQTLLEHKPAPPQPNAKRTKFEAFKVSAQINKGVATTKDLTISSPVLRVTGQGSANVSNKAIDFQVLATILKSPTASVADIPMRITGSYSDPTVRPDLEALAKGQLKHKLQDVLQDKLKGLFGK